MIENNMNAVFSEEDFIALAMEVWLYFHDDVDEYGRGEEEDLVNIFYKFLSHTGNHSIESKEGI